MVSVALASGIPVFGEFGEFVAISEGASAKDRTHEIGFENFASRRVAGIESDASPLESIVREMEA